MGFLVSYYSNYQQQRQSALYMLIHGKNPDELTPVHCPSVSVLNWGTTKVTFQWKYERNSPFWYAYYNPTPGASIVFNGKEIALTPDIILLLPPHTPFSSKKTDDFEQVWFHFTTGVSMEIQSAPITISAMHYLPFLERICTVADPNPFLLSGFISLVLSEIPKEQWSGAGTSYEDKRMQQALVLLSKYKSIAEVSRHLGMSTGNFQRAFKRAMRLTPKKFSLQMRLENARCSLELTQQTIDDIARHNGFVDRYAFSKAFRNYFGCPPAAYRNQQK